MTEPSKRDLDVVRYVARFRQLSAAHIQQLVFSDLTSTTPCYRSLNRLLAQNYLHRIERRIVGGGKGGSGQHVYALGRRGYFLHFDGRYSPARAVSHHALGIAETYLVLLQLHRQGKLFINGISTEPDCWRTVAGIDLKPDMYADLTLPDLRRLPLWIEVDMATEGQRQIRGQIDDYFQAWNNATEAEIEPFPLVLWVAVDEERAKELRWLIDNGHEDARALFKVTTLEKLPSLFVPVDN